MNKLIRKSRLAIALVIGALGAAACAPPPVMIADAPLGDRIVRFGMQRNVAGTGVLANQTNNSNQSTFNLLMQACSVDPNGQPANCRGALVLDRVSPNTLY